MDPDLGRFATVWAAAGTPNTVFAVTPATLRMLANATVTPISNAAVPRFETADDLSSPDRETLTPRADSASAASGA